jgi:NAD(P)-dependent dehydrogenase (short-subunit alcohol dehydrogenase family)
MTLYKASKLANVLFTYELDRRAQGRGVRSNAICPGFVPETLAERQSGLRRFFTREVLARMPFAQRLERASTYLADLATDPALDGVGGKFYCEGAPTPSSPASHDTELARGLWAVSATLCDLPDAL